MLLNLFSRPGDQAAGVRAPEREHHRRGPGLVLVHEPHRHARAHRRGAASGAGHRHGSFHLEPGPSSVQDRAASRPASRWPMPPVSGGSSSWNPPSAPEAPQRRRNGGHEDLLGARLQPGGELSSPRSGPSSSSSATRCVCDAVRAGERPMARSGTRQPFSRAASLVPTDFVCWRARRSLGKPLGGFRVPRYEARRSQRRHPSRASPRASRAEGVRGLDEPGRPEGAQHAGRAGSRERPRPSSATTCWTSGRRSASARSVHTNTTKAGSTSSTSGPRRSACLTGVLFCARGKPAVPQKISVGRPIRSRRVRPRFLEAARAQRRLLGLRADDNFWAARRVAAFGDRQIRSIVRAGRVQRRASRHALGQRLRSRAATKWQRAT